MRNGRKASLKSATSCLKFERKEQFMQTTLQLTPTWNPRFALPYESDWSIREKYTFMNAVPRYILKICEIRNLRASSEETIPFLNQLKRVELMQFTNDYQMRICPECIKYGYHSNLHQLLLYDTCFIHKSTNLITTNISFQYNDEPHNYYATNNITTVNNIVENEQLLNKIIKATQEFTENKLIHYINVNESTVGKNIIFSSTKNFILSQISLQPYNQAGIRTVLTIAKKDLPELNDNAMNELSDKYPLVFVKDIALNNRIFYELYTSVYMKILIDDFINNEFDSEAEYYNEVSRMDSLESHGTNRRKCEIDRYAKTITIMHIINSREPSFYHKLLTGWHLPPSECVHPINIAAIMSKFRSTLVKYISFDMSVKETDILIFAHAFLKDILDDTSRRLAAKIRSEEFDLFDDMMINRENFYIPASQYVLLDEVDKVTLYACQPE